MEVLIVGASEHARVIVDIFEKEGKYFIIGFIDTFKNIGEINAGYKVIGKEENIPEIISQHPGCKLFIAIGDNWMRQQIREKIFHILPSAEYASAIHPSVQIGKNVTIGKGVAIMAGVVINSDSHIGDFTIINTRSGVDHDCNIGNFSSLAPNVTLGGKVTVGIFTTISIGAVISHGIQIGNHAVIGAGSLLLKDCDDHTVMYGSPAKSIRKRESGEKYL